MRWREVGHVTGYDLPVASDWPDETSKSSNLIIQERDLLRNVLDDQLEFEPEVLTSEHRVIVFIDVRLVASCLRFGHLLQGIRKFGDTTFEGVNEFLLTLPKERR